MSVEQATGQPAEGSLPSQNTGLENGLSSDPQISDGQADPNVKAEDSPRYQQRIDELTQARKSEAEKVRSLELKLAELEGRTSQANTNDPWTNMTGEQLLSTAIDTKGEFDEAVRQEAMSRYHHKMNEPIQAIQKQTQAQQEYQVKHDDTWNRIRSDFGGEADTVSSPLRLEAQKIFEGFKAKLGDQIASNPDYEYLAFQQASQNVVSTGDARVRELEQELSKLKEKEGLEIAGNLAVSSMNERNRAVANGNVKDQLKSLSKHLLASDPVQ